AGPGVVRVRQETGAGTENEGARNVSCAGRALGLWVLCMALGAATSAGQDVSKAQAATPQGDAAISGRVVDPTGVGVAGAGVKLAGSDAAGSQQILTDSDGRFLVAHAHPGPGNPT